MPVYKIVPHDRHRRVLVTGSNLIDVIHKGREKLELPDEPHKIVLEDDGTVVDEDDVLLEIGKGSAIVTLMLLAEGQSWRSAILLPVVDATEPPREERRNDPPRPNDPHGEVPDIDIGLNVWGRFPKRLLDRCEAGTSVIDSDRRSMVQILADYMICELKDPTRKCAARIAQHIVSKYPKSFQHTINDNVVGSGFESLRTWLYNVVAYRKEQNKSQNNTVVDEISDDEAAQVSNVSRKRDEYGCVDYQPLLADGESIKSQEEKRLTLQQLFVSEEQNRDEIMKLIGSTYATQRLAINAKNRDLSALLTNWPCLTKSQYLATHASRLLAKDIVAVWNTMAAKKGKATIAYFKSTYGRRERKRNSKKEPSKMDNVAIKGLAILAEAKQSLTAERSEIPATAVMFPLLTNHFQESAESLYQVDTESKSVDELKEQVGPYPVLIIQGQTFYDEQARFVVIIEKCLFNASSLLDGIFTIIIAYYVFGYAYPENICRTLEFIQRTLLSVNPEFGHKRLGKRRKSHSFDPKVINLSKEIEALEEEDGAI